MTNQSEVILRRCPLCGGSRATEQSVPEPNLYSEKLALLLDHNEERLLKEHANWRCSSCSLIFKRRWFADRILEQLFSEMVPTHPRGWDTVGDRFSEGGFRNALAAWHSGLEAGDSARIARGQRELLSIIDSIIDTGGFERDAAVAAIRSGDTRAMSTMAPAVIGCIGEPAPYKRFSGFRSHSLWSYLQNRTGGFDTYAEVGCPLWGLLPLALDSGVSATYLSRHEPNYWGANCVDSAGRHCSVRLRGEGYAATTPWGGPRHHSVLGVFHYLDHVVDPRRFLGEVFSAADSAAIILDSAQAPVAIQHVTGWDESSMTCAAELFGKQMLCDFTEIRESGSLLYLLKGEV